MGLRATYGLGAQGFLDYSHVIKRKWGELSGFASAYAGVTKAGGTWSRDAGAVAGMRLRW